MDYFASIRSIHFSKADRLLVGASLLTSLLVLIYMLQPDDSSTRKDLKHLADLTSSEFKVKRKYSGAISWSYINKGAALFNQDEIFNDNKTSAKISFINSKTTITLPPNSLISIEEDHEKVTLIIKEGQAELNLGKDETMNVQSGEKILKVSSSAASKVTITNSSGQLSVATNSGAVLINDKEKSIKVKQDQVLNVNKDSKELIITQFNIQSPSSGQEFDLYKEPVFVKLSNPISGEVLISSDTNFEIPIMTKELRNNSELVLNELKEGNYFLKVVSGKESSSTKAIKVTNNPTIVPLSPLNGETLSSRPLEEGVILKWEKQTKGSTTEIEVTKAGEQKPTNLTFTKGESSAKINGLKGDGFSWRARTIYKGKESAYSPLNNIKFDFNRPIILEKEWQPKISSLDAINLKWNKVLDKEKFNISLIPINNESIKPIEKIISDFSVKLERLKRGKYNFKIASVSYPGSNNTLTKDLTVTSPVFEWDKAPRLASFAAIEPLIKLNLKLKAIDTNPIILEVTYNKTKGSSLALNADHSIVLKEFGSYCIKGKGRIDDFFEDTTDYCFEFKSMPAFTTIPRPVDQVMKYTKKSNNIDAYILKAVSVPRAAKYEFYVYRDIEGKKQVFKNESATPESDWMSNRSGVYYFRYKVIDNKGRSSEFSPMSRLIFPISPIDEL